MVSLDVAREGRVFFTEPLGAVRVANLVGALLRVLAFFFWLAHDEVHPGTMSTFRLWQLLVVTVSVVALALGSLAFFDQKLDIRLLIPGLVILGVLLGRLRCPHCGWPVAFDPRRFPRPLIKPRRVCAKCGESLERA